MARSARNRSPTAGAIWIPGRIRSLFTPAAGRLQAKLLGNPHARGQALHRRVPIIMDRPASLTPTLRVSRQSSGPCLRIEHLERILAVVRHHDERPAARGRTDLEDLHDVRVTGQAAHRPLLTHEQVEIVRIEVGRQDLDGDRSVEHRLDAPIDDAEAAVALFGDIVEPRVPVVPRGCQEPDPAVSHANRRRPSTVTILDRHDNTAGAGRGRETTYFTSSCRR